MGWRSTVGSPRFRTFPFKDRPVRMLIGGCRGPDRPLATTVTGVADRPRHRTDPNPVTPATDGPPSPVLTGLADEAAVLGPPPADAVPTARTRGPLDGPVEGRRERFEVFLLECGRTGRRWLALGGGRGLLGAPELVERSVPGHEPGYGDGPRKRADPGRVAGGA